MVTETQYMTALRTVEQYHSQIGLAGTIFEKTVFGLKAGDSIRCLKIRRGNMSDTLTVDKNYPIVSREGDYIWLRNDKGRLNRYEISIEYWGLGTKSYP